WANTIGPALFLAADRAIGGARGGLGGGGAWGGGRGRGCPAGPARPRRPPVRASRRAWRGGPPPGPGWRPPAGARAVGARGVSGAEVIMGEPSLSALLARWEEAFEQGRDLDAAEVCHDCPERAEEVEALLSGFRSLERFLGRPAGDVETPRPPDSAQTATEA